MSETGGAAADPVVRPTTEETAAIVGGEAVRRRRIGESDLEVFPIALSGNVFGWTAGGRATTAVLDAFHEFGGDFVDTADAYAGGRSEVMIGQWMAERRNRDDMVVATKIGKGPDHPGLAAGAIRSAVEDSLRRLQTDRIDLLYLHVDDPVVEFDETLLAVDDLIRAGKVRWFGGSDHTGERLFLARIACAHLGVAPMVALQNRYNLVHRADYESGLAAVAEQQGLAVMPRFALAGGFLSGKYRSKGDIARAARGREISRYATRQGMRVLAALDEIAEAHGVAPAAIAIAWLLARPLVVAPVVSATDPEQVLDLMAAPRVGLTRQQVDRLDKVSQGL